MFDFNMYAATKDNLGGPLFIEDQYSPLSPNYFMYDMEANNQPLTLGRAIGRSIAAVLLIGTGAYLALGL